MRRRIYAIVPGTPRISIAGTRVIRVGAIAAVVGPLSTRLEATPARLRAHDATIRRIAMQSPAVLPARFNTIVADDDELRVILEERQDALRRALSHVRRRVQMTIRLPGLPNTPPKTARPRTGAEYLRGRASAYRVPAFEPIRTAVAPWIRDERMDQRAGVLSVYHLIPRSAVEEYRRAAAAAIEQSAVRALQSGPFPPYAFAENW